MQTNTTNYFTIHVFKVNKIIIKPKGSNKKKSKSKSKVRKIKNVEINRDWNCVMFARQCKIK